MDQSKSKIIEFLLFFFLVLFPFGQIIRPFHPIDFISVLFLVLWLTGKFSKPAQYKYFINLLIVAIFSLVFSLTIFSLNQIILGSLYLLRAVSYFCLFLVTWNLAKKKPKIKNLIISSLLVISVFVGIFGWIQYFFLPDIRSFVIWGWDDHLYRMFGTFLDPGFTSIILALGGILTLAKKSWLTFIFLAFSLLFTYARVGYLVFLFGIFVLGVYEKRILTTIFLIFSLLFLIFFLPRPGSEGVKLERLSSVYPRVSNYSQSFEIIKKYPIFGVGFDNLCALKRENPVLSHSCAGSDSSVLTILETVGIVGFLIFINLIVNVIKSIDKESIYGHTIIASMVGLAIGSLFINALFYPWIMGWMAILMATGVKD